MSDLFSDPIATEDGAARSMNHVLILLCSSRGAKLAELSLSAVAENRNVYRDRLELLHPRIFEE